MYNLHIKNVFVEINSAFLQIDVKLSWCYNQEVRLFKQLTKGLENAIFKQQMDARGCAGAVDSLFGRHGLLLVNL